MRVSSFTVVLIQLLNKVSFLLPDKPYLKWQFKLRMGFSLDLEQPRSLSEKIQWLKIFNRNSHYISLVDKYLVKDTMASIIGPYHIIST